MEFEHETTCPHCGEVFMTTVSIEPEDVRIDRD
jgi:hypothetical protein